jgi:hypothetical protein
MRLNILATIAPAIFFTSALTNGCSMQSGDATGVAEQASTRGGGGGGDGHNNGGNSSSGGQGSSGGSSSSSSGGQGSSSSSSSSGGQGSSGGSSSSSGGQGSSGGSSSSSGGQGSSSSGGSSSVTCPSPSSQDDQMRAAATAAFNIMKGAAQSGASFSTAVLASQRYRIQSTGTGIEFDPTDPVYSQVTNQMKSALAVAQLDPTVAKFLSDGLTYAYQTSNGSTYPLIRAIPALANFQYPKSLTVSVPDTTANSDVATVTGTPWCSTFDVHIAQTLTNTWQFSPLFASNVTDWRGNPPAAFKGSGTRPTVPFNGATSAGNPYLIVSVDGATTNWGNYNFVPSSCFDAAHYDQASGTFICKGSIDIDPIPYTQPGAYYDPSGNPIGPQTNPYALTITNLYADPSHAGQWATRTVSGVQQWGTFSTPVNVLGTTVYLYVKKM